MKAQILKIAGVKNESEFYRKFPTEAEFMAKHGKELKKAQAGAIIKPMAMPKVEMTNLAKAKDFGLTKLKDIPASKNRNYNYKDALGMGITALPEIISGVSGIVEDQRTLDKSKKYAKLAELAASVPQEQLPQRQYVRPEDYLVEDFNKYGVAQNGAMIGGNPTEIQNMYNPGDMYSDLAYEPLNDSNPKQYQFGGSVDYGQLAPLLGNFASGVGSYGAGGGFRQGNYGKTASAIGGIAGTAIGGPIGGMVGSTFGGLIGGGFDADALAQQQAIDEKRDAFLGSAAFGNTRKQQFGAYTKNGGSIPSYEDGGWVSNDWMPQTITKFGDYNMKELLAPPHDADMLRAGGHLKEYTPPNARAMYTGRDLPYQMANGGQMAMGGDLEVHRGKAETMSYNPFLPNGGETIMFRGPSHDDGGMPISFGQNGVEVEGGEPAIKMQDGGQDDNLVVYGNMVIPNYGAAEIGDEKAKGKKFKNYVADLSKIEAKQNKIAEKSATLANDTDVTNPFDKLTLNTAQANMLGTTMKLKNIADKKMNAAAVQNAILDTAKEHGLVSDELAKGKIKVDKDNNMYAKFGAKLETAEDGKNVQPALSGLLNLLYRKGYDIGNVSGKRSGKTAQGKQSRHSIGEALDIAFNKLGSKAYDVLTKDYDVVNYLVKNGLTAINEYDPKVRAKTKGTAGHIHFGYDKGTPVADKFRKKFDPNTQIPGKNFGDNWSNERQIWQPNNMFPTNGNQYDTSLPPDSWADDGSAYWKPILGVPQEFSDGYGWDKTNPMEKLWGPGTGIPTTFPNPKTSTGLLGKDYDPGYNEQPFWKPRNLEYTPSEPLTETRTVTSEPGKKSNAVQQAIINAKGKSAGTATYNGATALQAKGTPTGRYDWNNELMGIRSANGEPTDIPFVDPGTAGWDRTDNYQYKDNVSNSVNQTAIDNSNNNSNDNNFALTALTSLMPYLRPSNQKPLDPAQLAGEIYAMATNTKQPVFAQTFTPDLTQPTRISLQDQVNKITSQANASKRLVGNNPAALASIDAELKKSIGEIMGEQFRMNQGEQQRAMETNRQTMNDARLKNLGIRQEQADKMAAVDANTRKENQAILSSLAAKTLQNKAENQQLAIAENMYNYRFDPQGRAYNVNAPYNFNIPNIGYGASSINEIGNGRTAKELRALADLQEEAIAKKTTKSTTGKNGAIVKAIKNL